MTRKPIVQRKKDHIDLALNQDSQINSRIQGFEAYELEHQALPECNLEDIDLTLKMLDAPLNAPIVIGSMTGGLEQGKKINRHLSEAAQHLGLAMGLGSQRVTIEHPETLSSFQVRDFAPDILLMANLGAVQLNLGYGLKECLQAIESVDANALYLHLNPLQEAIQPGGDTQFSHLTEQITELCAALPYPVLVKECGAGISTQTAERLIQAGVAGIEISGHGGTSWAWIEAQRNPDPAMKRLGNTFAHWGIPTPRSIQHCRQVSENIFLIGSGGIRTGLDAARAIALGANAVSLAQPLLQAALCSTEAVIAELEVFILELKIAMFCSGARNLSELHQTPILHRGEKI